VIAQSGEVIPHCPCCGITETEKLGLPLMDQLLRSHAELRAALRLAGRLVLRFERQDHQSLEQIRGTLKRAENISKSLSIPDDPLEERTNMDKFFTAAATQAPGNPGDGASGDSPVHTIIRKKNRLTRPHSLRIIKSPTG